MINSLKIKNFAIIESLEVEFGDGMNIITGETGAGKSIIIEALNVGLGERASTEMIRSGEKKATIEVDLNFPLLMESISEENKETVQNIFQETEIPEESSLIMRRDLYTSGRNRAFMNDIPVNLATFKRLGDIFVDIHGQHEHQSLLNEKNHIQFLDAFGDYQSLIFQTRKTFFSMLDKKTTYQKLQSEKEEYREKRELYEYQLKEIEIAEKDIARYEELKHEYEKLQNSEKLQKGSILLGTSLYDSEESIYVKLQELKKLADDISRLDPTLEDLLSRLKEIAYEIQDIGQAYQHYSSELVFSSAYFEDIQERIFNVESLIKKYGGSIDSLQKKYQELHDFLIASQDYEEESARLKAEYEQLKQQYIEFAHALSNERKQAAKKFESAIREALSDLGFRQARFSVELSRNLDQGEKIEFNSENLTATESGIDKVRFLISANPGEELRPLSRIASGGEISRIMLGIKSIMAGKKGIPIIIFDEIDSGISGKIAAVVGTKLREISNYHQIICITHLPQIASSGEHHFSVSKYVKDGRTSVTIRKLEGEERVLSLAALIGGAEVNLSGIEHARQLLRESKFIGKDSNRGWEDSHR